MSERQIMFALILFFVIVVVSLLVRARERAKKRRLPSPLLTDPAAGIERRSELRTPYPTYGGPSAGLGIAPADPHPGKAPELEPDGGVAAPELLKAIAERVADPSFVDPDTFAAVPAGDRAGIAPRIDTGD